MINLDLVATCVKPQGRSVDLCMGNTQMRMQEMVSKVKVLTETVTISDHRLISIDLVANRATKISSRLDSNRLEVG